MSTFMAKPGQVEQRWFVIDATNQVVGRLAVQIANILRGKHRPEYTPHVDTGEYVIVINAEKIRFTGKKLQTKSYKSYTHYPGGLKEVSARVLDGLGLGCQAPQFLDLLAHKISAPSQRDRLQHGFEPFALGLLHLLQLFRIG